ncbi:MAG TPA: hypothetical protein VFM01_12880 [Nakamurella sp.]|nr:hypothetical protein [Nakamurella sp.]
MHLAADRRAQRLRILQPARGIERGRRRLRFGVRGRVEFGSGIVGWIKRARISSTRISSTRISSTGISGTRI